MEVHPPVPGIPVEHSTRSPSADRRSVSTAADGRSRRREGNRIRNKSQIAAPEVISSLIDSLSAISGSAQRHFDGVPIAATASLPDTPDTLHTNNPFDAYAGSNALVSSQDADAAEPPVIRTSKPPSGLSPITAPKKREKEGSFKNYLRSPRDSSTSLRSCRSMQDLDDAASIGNISIDNTVRRPSNSSRLSNESKRSGRGHRSLMYISSMERLRSKDVEHSKRATVAFTPYNGTSATIDERQPVRQSSQSSSSTRKQPKLDKLIQEEYTASGPSRLSVGKNPARDEPESPVVAGLVPERNSSLRHNESPQRKRHSRRSSKGKTGRSARQALLEEDETKAARQDKRQRDAVKYAGPDEELEADRRIKELKAQKQIREKISQNLQIEPVTESHYSGLHALVSGADRFGGSPTASASTLSSLSEERSINQDHLTKAHKVLGITVPPPPPPKDSPTSDESAVRQTQSSPPWSASTPLESPIEEQEQQQEQQRDDADAPPSPLTPVRVSIDYKLALQTLGQYAPSPPSSQPSSAEPKSAGSESKGSSDLKGTSNYPDFKFSSPTKIELNGPETTKYQKTESHEIMRVQTVSGGSRGSEVRWAEPREAKSSDGKSIPSRSQSVGMGGRSALSRRRASLVHESKDIDGNPIIQTVGSPVSRRATRSSSQDFSNRHLSMQIPPTSGLKVPAGSAKKRSSWSHPDLPLEMDRKYQRDHGAVKPPPQPVIEERADTADSIDHEVDVFLDSQRLSQRVRHPQTGRSISFSEVGDPNGHAIFCCVGMGLTRYVMAFYHELAASLKLRLITPERPGIGDSQADPQATPLRWPDDVLTICQHLRISKFSLLAHSAGAVYALATALRMPQHIRGRVHLLAPWIPPSMMAPIGIHQDSPPAGQLPRSQRFLRALPPSFLKVANSSFLSTTSASITRNVPKTPKNKRKSTGREGVSPSPGRPSMPQNRRESMLLMDQVLPNGSALSVAAANPQDPNHKAATVAKELITKTDSQRLRMKEERLTFAIWDRATANANPATDLIVCLETKQTIGFRYEDITRGVVIHHGSKDSRVPVDNVRWLGRVMRKCEVRILEGEQHGLMASAVVMGNVLTEMAKEWEDWTAVVEGRGLSTSPQSSRGHSRGKTTKA